MGQLCFEIEELFYFYSIIQILIYQDTTAVFTHNYFLPLPDLTLLLRRDSIEASTAGISFNGYYSQAVAIVLADAVI